MVCVCVYVWSVCICVVGWGVEVCGGCVGAGRWVWVYEWFVDRGVRVWLGRVCECVCVCVCVECVYPCGWVGCVECMWMRMFVRMLEARACACD